MDASLLWGAIALVTLGFVALWWWMRRLERQTTLLLHRATDGRTHLIEATPPAPFDRLVTNPEESLMPQLVRECSGGPLRLWIEPEWLGSDIVVLASVPYERSYKETSFFMSITWAPAADQKTVRQTTDLIKRLYLDGRELRTGRVWQGYQLVSTNPDVIEACLPHDLPRTGADRAYEQLTRILLLSNYAIFMFATTTDPEQLKSYLTLVEGLAPALNTHLGPLPNPFRQS